MAHSGVDVEQEVIDAFNNLKTKKTLRFMIARVSDDLKKIIIEAQEPRSGEDDIDSDAIWDKFKDLLPNNAPRYVIYSLQYTLLDGGVRDKVQFFTWNPENSKIKDKMIFASSKDSFKQKLNLTASDLQFTEKQELNREEIIDQVSSKRTKQGR